MKLPVTRMLLAQTEPASLSNDEMIEQFYIEQATCFAQVTRHLAVLRTGL